jgi:hypothetical protein
VFERSQSIGVTNEGQCELYRRLFDHAAIIVKLIGYFDIANGSESENRQAIHYEIEKQTNLKHPGVTAPFGLVVSQLGRN